METKLIIVFLLNIGAIHVLHLLGTRGVDVNSKKGCFRRKKKLSQESEEFAGSREAWEIFRETGSNEVKFGKL